MSHQVTIEDLPDEMLEKILLNLRLDDRKSALRVCKRWSALKPFDFSSVQLIIDSDRFYEKDNQGFYRALLASSRRYKHVAVHIRKQFEYYDLVLEILSSFSGSVESLKFNFELTEHYEWPTAKFMVFAKIAALSKLKHLQINECMFESDGSDLGLPSMKNLEELNLKNNLLDMIPTIQDKMPNITKLHLLIRSEASLNFLQSVSSRLVELEIWFEHEDDFLVVCTMQFPLLKKVTFSGSEVTYFDPSILAMSRFFQQLRARVVQFTLRSLSIDHVGNLCNLQSCENIYFLQLCEVEEAEDFRAICELKHLKRLQIEDGLIEVPEVFDFSPLSTLEMLSLDGTISDNFKFNRFRRYAFPSLVIFEILHLNDMDVDTYELFDYICSDIPLVTRLTLLDFDVPLGQFLEFCASRAPRELRVRCRNLFDENPLQGLRPIPVETLILEVQDISLDTLQKLIKSMGQLTRLELGFKSKDYRSAFNPCYTMPPEAIQSLRDAFPRCDIVEKLKVQIVEPLW